MPDQLTYVTTTRFLSKYIRKHMRNVLMHFFGFLLISVLSIIRPVMVGILIDEIVYYQNIDVFFRIAALYVVFVVLYSALHLFSQHQQGYLMNMYAFDIRKDVFVQRQKNDAQFLSGVATGETMQLIQYFSDECSQFLTNNINYLILNALKIVALAIYLLIIDWRIGTLALIAAPISTYIFFRFRNQVRKTATEQRTIYNVYAGWLIEMLTGLRDIRMLGARKRTEDLLEQKHKDIFGIDIKLGLANLTAEYIVAFTLLITQLSIFAFAGYAALQGHMTMGVLTIIVSFYAAFSFETKSLSTKLLNTQMRISYIQRIRDALNTPIEEEWTGRKTLEISEGRIDFEGVSYAYQGGEQVLRDFTLSITPGERVALVSHSGGGKTTLAYMLIGFYLPGEGEIRIDGQPLSNFSLSSIRQSIGLVQQDVLIFDGTIRENIALGKLSAPQSELEAAYRSAGLGEFIDSLPQGIDTVIGSKGVGLSGGQKQRIAIARVYLKNPRIIIFDEATSSLDDATEKAIHEAWQQVLANRTAIIIAHRQSAVMLCDRVALIENGRVAETGSPSELAEHSEKFRSLFALREGA